MPKNALIAFLLTICASVGYATPQSTTGGFYLVCNPSQGGVSQTYCQTAAAMQYLDTASTVHNNLELVIAWRDLEPSDGVYNWTGVVSGGNQSYDTYIANAVALGMNISIALVAGIQTPQWIYDTVPSVTFSPINPGNGNCFSGSGNITGTTLTIDSVANGTVGLGTILTDSNESAVPVDTYITALGTGTGGTGTYTVSRSSTTGTVTVQSALLSPAAWNSTFLAKYNAAMSAIATHLASVNGTLDARPYVKVVKLAGINNSTEEFRNLAGTGGGICNSVSANALWAAAGWTPTNITTAFNSILANDVSAFGSSPFPAALIYTVDTIQINGMPAVDDNGTVYVAPPARTDEVSRTVLKQMLQNAAYATRTFSCQWNAVSNNIIAPQPSMCFYVSVDTGGFSNDVSSWQLNERGGTNGGSDCYYTAIPITFTGALSGGATSATLVSNAIQLNGNNTVTFSDAETRQALFNSATTAVTWSNGLSGAVTASAIFTGFANCDYGGNTGTGFGDYEQVLSNATLSHGKYIEYYGVDITDIQGAINSLQSKSMRLPQ